MTRELSKCFWAIVGISVLVACNVPRQRNHNNSPANTVREKTSSRESFIYDTVGPVLSPCGCDDEPQYPLDEEKIYDVVEEMPKYPGGIQAIRHFIDSVMVYPEAAKERGIQGRVVVKCVVNKDGSLSDFEVVRSMDPALDEEAVRILKKMPKWTPGSQKGVVLKVYYFIPVNFRLEPPF